MPELLTPAMIGTVKLKNRVIFPSMCLYFSDPGGNVTDKLYTFIMKRAKAGVGGFIVPANPHGKNKPNRASLADDSFIAQWQSLTGKVHAEDARIFCQLHPVGIQYGRADFSDNPLENPTEVVEALIESYAQGALRAKKAGFDGVEIHGAHGHEIALFLSALLNKRTDKYGGDLAGRARIVTDMITRIKQYAGPGFPVILRISGEEKLPGGREIEGTLELCRLIEAAGADAIHVSAGMPASEEWECPSSDISQGHLGPIAGVLKKNLGIPIIVAGRIVDWKIAEEIVIKGQADFVAVGRALLAEPLWMQTIGCSEAGLLRRCIGCNQGCRTKRGREKSPTTCLQNPLLGQEECVVLQEDGGARRACIVGAGVSGLEAAHILSQRGFAVTVYEKENQIGGIFRWASLPPGKKDYENLLRYYENNLTARGVTFIYNYTVEQPPAGFDFYILAVGGKDILPDIVQNRSAIKAVDILPGQCPDGEKFVVIGDGLVGYETADYLIEKGKEVILAGDSLEEPLERLGIARWHFMQERLQRGKMQVLRDTRVTAIGPDGFTVKNSEGKTSDIKGQFQYVLACGYKANEELYNRFQAFTPAVHLVGSAKGYGSAMDSIHDAFQTTVNLLL